MFQELLKWPQALWDNAEILLQTFILLDELKDVISLMYSNWHLSNISVLKSSYGNIYQPSLCDLKYYVAQNL